MVELVVEVEGCQSIFGDREDEDGLVHVRVAFLIDGSCDEIAIFIEVPDVEIV